ARANREHRTLGGGGKDTETRAPLTARREVVPSGVLERDDDLVPLETHCVLANAETRIDDAAPGRNLELPLVPGTAQDARALAEAELAVPHLDRRRDPAGADGRAAMRAAVGESVQAAVDPDQPDAVAVDLEPVHGPFLRRVVDRQPSFTLRRRSHAGAATGRRKNVCAFRQRTLSRHSAGSCRSVCSGSSKSQCGKSLAYISVSAGRRNSIARTS